MQAFSRRQFLATSAAWFAVAPGHEFVAKSRDLKSGGHLRLGTQHDASGLDSHRFPQGHTDAQSQRSILD